MRAAVAGQAIAQLSLSHTLETAAEQVARLLHVERVAIYLEEPDGLVVATERQLEGPHAEVAERLLELALGRYRARGSLSLEHILSSIGLFASEIVPAFTTPSEAVLAG